jgi:DNA (cytosine-5)-methyltransferase 1
MTFVSLFSGAMGLDLGLEMAGFHPRVCVENDPEAVKTIRLNRPTLPILGDITRISGADIQQAAGLKDIDIDLVAGGPPCQAFSVFGKRQGLEDSRGQLLWEFVRIIGELRPHCFILENVRGLLSMPIIPQSKKLKEQENTNPELHEHGSLMRLLLQKFHEIGYRVDCYVVNAVNYGAPQLRERIISANAALSDLAPLRLIVQRLAIHPNVWYTVCNGVERIRLV